MSATYRWTIEERHDGGPWVEQNALFKRIVKDIEAQREGLP